VTCEINLSLYLLSYYLRGKFINEYPEKTVGCWLIAAKILHFYGILEHDAHSLDSKASDHLEDFPR
jgi:hypothetical protein